jgi:hypothetical protein
LSKDTNVVFLHNHIYPSNIIIQDDKIVGVIDWEMSGFFQKGCKGLSPYEVFQKGAFIGLSVLEDRFNDLTFWSNLYH